MKGQPPCPEGRPKTCADGSTPTGHGRRKGYSNVELKCELKCSIPAKCDDGTKPTCADGSAPVKVKGQPPCPEGRPKTCADGSTPAGHGGSGCPRYVRICCDGSDPKRHGKRLQCEDGGKPVCSQDEC